MEHFQNRLKKQLIGQIVHLPKKMTLCSYYIIFINKLACFYYSSLIAIVVAIVGFLYLKYQFWTKFMCNSAFKQGEWELVTLVFLFCVFIMLERCSNLSFIIRDLQTSVNWDLIFSVWGPWFGLGNYSFYTVLFQCMLQYK